MLATLLLGAFVVHGAFTTGAATQITSMATSDHGGCLHAHGTNDVLTGTSNPLGKSLTSLSDSLRSMWRRHNLTQRCSTAATHAVTKKCSTFVDNIDDTMGFLKGQLSHAAQKTVDGVLLRTVGVAMENLDDVIFEWFDMILTVGNAVLMLLMLYYLPVEWTIMVNLVFGVWTMSGGDLTALWDTASYVAWILYLGAETWCT